MRFLEVYEDGSISELPDLELSSEKVLIVVDEDDKRIWLWKGVKCPIRKKFIGSRALSDLRKKEYGIAYIPQTCDQNDETAEFVAMVQKLGKENLISQEVLEKAKQLHVHQRKINVFADPVDNRPQYSEEDLKAIEEDTQLKERPGQVSTANLPTKFQKMGAPGNRPTPSILSTMDAIEENESKVSEPTPTSATTSTPKPTPITPQKPSPTRVSQQPTGQEMRKRNEELLQKSFSILTDLGVPKGFYRDLVIIGSKVYTESYDGTFDELDEPPEGVFFSSSHVPRMICENGVVRAIEFLKPEEGAELSEEDEKIAQDIDDILSMFEIDIG